MDNDPTSNPKILCEQFCRIARGQAQPHDISKWSQIKRTLITVLWDMFDLGTINAENREKGLAIIYESSEVDATPIILIIARDDGMVIETQDVDYGEEYIIEVDTGGNIQVIVVDCDDLLDILTES